MFGEGLELLQLPPASQQSGAQPGATLGASGLDHRATTTGSHTRTESVRSLLLQFAWLKCTFHLDRPVRVDSLDTKGFGMYCFNPLHVNANPFFSITFNRMEK